MDQIQKFECKELAGAEISCIIVKGNPWFRGNDVASVLGYANHSKAVYDHVPLKFKHKLSFLMSIEGGSKTEPLDANVLNTHWISEAGLYKLVLKSKLKAAEIFSDWVCSEVLPAIRKTGSYNAKYRYRKDNITQQEVQELAHGQEDELHYNVVKHIKKRYPDAMIQAGLGEHLTTLHAKLDAKLKGYSSGQPDITVIRKLPNGFQDALAIELKHPDGTKKLKKSQREYHETLKDNCNIETIVGHVYEDIIIAIHEHYQQVMRRAKPQVNKETERYNFAQNENTKYWQHKLNKTQLLNECELRDIKASDLQFLSNREIASVLITFDKERV